MLGAKTRTREKVVIAGSLLVVATLAFILIEKFLSNYDHPRYPNPTAAVMSPTDYLALCTNDATIVTRDVMALAGPSMLDTFSENHFKLEQDAFSTEQDVNQMVEYLDGIKPPDKYTNYYTGFLDQLVSINGALKMYERDAHAGDIKAIKKDDNYMLSLVGSLKSYLPPIAN